LTDPAFFYKWTSTALVRCVCPRMGCCYPFTRGEWTSTALRAASALGGAAPTRSLTAGALPCLRSLRVFPFTALVRCKRKPLLRWRWMGGVGWGRVLGIHNALHCGCPRRGCCYPFTRGRGPPLPSFTTGVSVYGACAP